MEIEEIRLNNILLLDNSKLVKILWIKPNTCSVMDVNVDYPSAIVDLDRLSGVELTIFYWITVSKKEIINYISKMIL